MGQSEPRIRLDRVFEVLNALPESFRRPRFEPVESPEIKLEGFGVFGAALTQPTIFLSET